MKKFYVFGVLSAFVYIASVILGGAIWPGYSHTTQAISELIMPGSPNQFIMQPLFWIYNLLLGLFSLGYFRWASNKLLRASALFLLLCALSGIILLIFPQDPIGAPLTTPGLLHLIFAGVSSLTTLLALFLAVFGFGKVDGLQRSKTTSLVFGLIVLISGPLTAMAPSRFPAHFGIFERVTIGAFILWLLLTSLMLKDHAE